MCPALAGGVRLDPLCGGILRPPVQSYPCVAERDGAPCQQWSSLQGCLDPRSSAPPQRCAVQGPLNRSWLAPPTLPLPMEIMLFACYVCVGPSAHVCWGSRCFLLFVATTVSILHSLPGLLVLGDPGCHLQSSCVLVSRCNLELLSVLLLGIWGAVCSFPSVALVLCVGCFFLMVSGVGLACVLPFGAVGLRWCLCAWSFMMLFASLHLSQPQRLLVTTRCRHV